MGVQTLETPDVPAASKVHTAGLLLLIVAVSVWVAMHGDITEWPRELATRQARVSTYLRMPLLPVLWMAYIWLGVRGRASLFAVIDGGRASRSRWWRYVGVGLAGSIVWLIASALLGGVMRPSAEQLRGLQALLPHDRVERWVWLACAPAAGLCEEVVYRGYLLRQFKAFTRSTAAALVLQAVAYASAHLILPVSMLPSIALLGLFLGLLVVWQRSLVPAMIVHVSVALAALAGAMGS
jgi:CAAX protease family protein